MTNGGLDDAEVAARVERGDVNRVVERSSRSTSDIVRANVLTRFNAILGALLAVIIVIGPFQDGLFGVVLVVNTVIGIVQEVRAKRALDRLHLLVQPQVRVVRSGERRAIAPDAIVVDDVLDLRAGDQLVVDADVLDGAGLEVDESLVSGESEPIAKRAGDALVSGSFVTAGEGRAVATRVGASTYVAGLAHEARQFSLARSELRDGIDRILRIVTWVIVPVGGLLVTRQLLGHHNILEAIRGSVAGVGSMVPEGLVLLTSVAFAVAVLRLGRRRVVVQELPAVEVLARVDVLCIDKTGTLTEGAMRLDAVELVDESMPGADALAALAAADPSGNATIAAIRAAAAVPPDWKVRRIVPFSSQRKWSAVDFGPHGCWYLGAPEVLGAAGADTRPFQAALDGHVRAGRRVVLVAAGADGADGPDPDRPELPAALRPAALAVLEERIRATATATLAWFASQGVSVKVLSGDHPGTVGAVAGRLGLPGADRPVDARTIADLAPDDLAAAMADRSVFGRVSPHQKRDMISALQQRGHVVAMTGDGVNDALAIKRADLGLAMGTGSAATRAVAQLVLLDNDFDALPAVVAEGRRVIANIERVANLFVTKTVYAALLSLAVGVAGLTFPFYPRHLTLVSSLTIGIPAFFLALAPAARARGGNFVGRVVRFAAPAGFVAAALTFTAYSLATSAAHTTAAQDRTTATIVLFSVGVWVLAVLARPWTFWRRTMVVSVVVAFAAALFVPSARDLLAMQLPPLGVGIAVVVVGLAARPLLAGALRLARWTPSDAVP
ncbi:MAG: ATPase, P-type (transporting), superfamily, subfamily [Acidimicrobiales bacterium]|nr:ATPase, P-type (transporting), superfamily, subfamily [Acidimicrobiales bacterium]